MKKFKITFVCNKKEFICKADTAREAVQLLCNHYGWNARLKEQNKEGGYWAVFIFDWGDKLEYKYPAFIEEI